MLSNPLSFTRDRRRGEDGFTLIELLVVVVILGILIGIAIPVYLNYRKSANDKAAQADVRSAVSTLEVCNSDSGYPSAVTAAGVMTGCDTQKITVSSGTSLRYVLAGGAYTIFARNSGGSGDDTSGRYYCYSSTAGGAVKSKTGNYATDAC